MLQGVPPKKKKSPKNSSPDINSGNQLRKEDSGDL